MTGASVSILLVGIVTVNIVWGYPWVGMFSACCALFFGGWTINRFMRPILKIDFSLPSWSPAGQPFSVVMHLQNRSQMPAIDLSVEFQEAAGNGRREKGRRSGRLYRSLTPKALFALIRPVERKDLSTSLLFERRGVHSLPDVVVTSMFPFHLFRSVQRHKSGATIAITPRLLSVGDDAIVRGQLHTLGSWSRKLLSGDALDYTGSREYEVGMPVRRWDFASWARLGRPIIREFQSPSIRMVTLIVDTSSQETDHFDPAIYDPGIERVLSLAATAVTDLTRKSVLVRMFVASELRSGMEAVEPSSSDTESLLIRLAAAETVSQHDADKGLDEALEHVGRAPALILTSRSDLPIQQSVPSNVTILNVQADGRDWPPEDTDRSTRKRRRRGRPRHKVSTQAVSDQGG